MRDKRTRRSSIRPVPVAPMFHVKHQQVVVNKWIEVARLHLKMRRPSQSVRRYREPRPKPVSMFHVKQTRPW